MSDASFRKNWPKIVEHYSSCVLTWKTDKLAALSHLAGHLQRIQSQSPQNQERNIYLHGLWARDVHQQLCWTPHQPDTDEDKVQQLITRLDGLISPTWSWASLDGKVAYDLAYNHFGSQTRLSWIQIGNTQIEDAFETSKVLTLRGIALFGTVEANDRPDSGYIAGTLKLSHALRTPGFHTENYWKNINPLKSMRIDEIWWDLPQWPSDLNPSLELCLLMVYMDQSDESNHGLILQPVSLAREPAEYIRLGTFKLEGQWDGDPGELTARSDFMQHIAARQGLESCTESIDYDAVWDLRTSMELEVHLDATSKASVFDRAERRRWIMDLDRPSMKDLVHIIRIR